MRYYEVASGFSADEFAASLNFWAAKGYQMQGELIARWNDQVDRSELIAVMINYNVKSEIEINAIGTAVNIDPRRVMWHEQLADGSRVVLEVEA